MKRLTSINCTIYKTEDAGTTVDGGVISQSFKPDNDPSTNWALMGYAKSVSLTNASEYYTSIVGVNGNQCPNAQICTKKQIDISIDFESLSEDFIAKLFSGKKTTTYAVYDGKARYEGWIKVSGYNAESEGASLFTVDLYVSLKPDNLALTVGEAQSYVWSGTVLYSSSNVLETNSI